MKTIDDYMDEDFKCDITYTTHADRAVIYAVDRQLNLKGVGSSEYSAKRDLELVRREYFRKLVVAEQSKCNHVWEYNGSYHNTDFYDCTKCNARKQEK